MSDCCSKLVDLAWNDPGGKQKYEVGDGKEGVREV